MKSYVNVCAVLLGMSVNMFVCECWRTLHTYSVTNTSVTFSDVQRCRHLKHCENPLEYEIKFGRHLTVDVFMPDNLYAYPMVVFAYEYPDTFVEMAKGIASSG